MDELHNKIFISTQPEETFPELEKYLNKTGATLLCFPMIEICEAEITESAEKIIKNTDTYDWLVFTSKNGVLYFLKKYKTLTGNYFEKKNSRIAVIGKKTGDEFIKAGIQPDYISVSNISEKFVTELKEKVIAEKSKVLLLLGNLAGDKLERNLSCFNEVTRINCYQTCKPKVKNTELLNRIFLNDYELIIFTSSSGFENFVSVAVEYRIELQKLRVVSIGKSTTGTMNKFGVKPVFTASPSNIEGIANELITLYKLKSE